MNIFTRIFKQLPFFEEIVLALKNEIYPIGLNGFSGIHKAQLAFTLSLETDKPIAFVCENEPSAIKLLNDINELAKSEIACFYPAKELSFTAMEGISGEYEQTRLCSLAKILDGRCKIMLLSIEGAMQRCIPKNSIQNYSFEIKSSDTLDPIKLKKKLYDLGYNLCDQIDSKGQFSVRGDIIDIFSIGEDSPVRIELWGDDIDTMSYFDLDSQRRTQAAEKVCIMPTKEIIFESTQKLCEDLQTLANNVKGKRAEKIKELILRDKQFAESGLSLTNADKYYNLAYSEKSNVLEYFSSGIVMFSEFAACVSKANDIISTSSEDIKMLFEEGILFKGVEDYLFEIEDIMQICKKSPVLTVDTFLRGNSDLMHLKKLITANCYQTGSWSGEFKQIKLELESFCKEGYCVIIMAGSEKTVPVLVDDLVKEGINCEPLKDNSEIISGKVYVTDGSVSGGFDYPDCKCTLITQIKSAKVRTRQARHKKGEAIRSLSDISKGDIVVHSVYGIGRFEGLSQITDHGITRDFITINYAGTDVLYVPVTSLDVISKYISASDNDKVKLTKLNSGEWKKTKNKVRAAVKDMADELLALYAKRQASKGYEFSEDTDWQKDFEERFPYRETSDQLRTISEIKADMQKPVPMDRLLCGDVGFGKTEVAFRCAFKCVMDNKQCAILAPTTVLAWQHFQSALKRFEHFPIKIELLSRFRTPKEQKEILRRLARGDIDIIIGTHRLVQKDVEFKDLGLAIVDEEQRFGVAHKEKFKEKFPQVDMLTLSATPIPRTLNMAMSGIRDMSVIEEPPQDRKPVQTYVIEHNDGIINQAIERELRRGGQVYYIHNRIESIEFCAEKLRKAHPDAVVEVAHGQMNEKEISDIWRRLCENEIDILVCTTIIETGVDVANCNTLIIENADYMGLAQLYQLRGRVGRSSRRAFAYFTFHRGKQISELSQKRLNAIREFTQFGSGFRIALRDLEIRGAGSVLSGKQHGHMEAVGYDMYVKLLNEAIAEQKGITTEEKIEDCHIDLPIKACIPESYIKSTSQRIDAYKSISMIRNSADQSDVLDEFIDRYGSVPDDVYNLTNVALMRSRAAECKITKISLRQDRIVFFTDSPSLNQITALAGVYGKNIKFENTKYPNFNIPANQKTEEIVNNVLDILEENK